MSKQQTVLNASTVVDKCTLADTPDQSRQHQTERVATCKKRASKSVSVAGSSASGTNTPRRQDKATLISSNDPIIVDKNQVPMANASGRPTIKPWPFPTGIGRK